MNSEQQQGLQNHSNVNNTEPAVDEIFYNIDTTVYICSLLLGLTITLTIYRSIKFFNVTLHASGTLHNKMLSNIIHCGMKFFNENPSGRILNRFSKDVSVADEILPTAVMDSLQVNDQKINYIYIGTCILNCKTF